MATCCDLVVSDRGANDPLGSVLARFAGRRTSDPDVEA